MASIGNNTSGKIAHVRDSYFDSGEKEYLEELLKDPKEREIHQKLMQKNVEILYRKARELMVRVELGEFDEKQMVEAEYKITHLLAGIEDLEKVLELELTRTTSKKDPDNVRVMLNKYREEELTR